MNDVLDRLSALRSPDPAVDLDTVAADVRRGRRALHRRRAVRGGVLAACSLAVAGVAGTMLRDPAPQVQHHDHLRLVAYDGPQAPGFTVTKVPEGFVLQGVTPFNLNVARPGDTSSVDSFADKIVVMLELTSPEAPSRADAMEAPDGARLIERQPGQKRFRITFEDGHVEYRKFPTVGDTAAAGGGTTQPAVEPFEVDGDSATITTNSEGTRTLRYVHGDYTVAIQVWPTLGLSDAQLVEFADGVSVTSDARPGLG